MSEREMTAAEYEVFKAIAKRTGAVRKKITLYKKNDESLALFRIQAFNHILRAMVRKVQGKRQLKKTSDWVKAWDDGSDLGNSIQDLFSQITGGKKDD